MPGKIDLRCPSCGRMLMRIEPSPRNNVEIRCTRCKAKVTIDGFHHFVSEAGRPRRVDTAANVP
jgi:phage FluMu protein Com